MSVESVVVAALTGNTTWAALVTDKPFPVQLPDNVTLPAAAYQVISGAPTASGKTKSFKEYRVQISCMASTVTVARSMRDAAIGVAFSNGWRWSLGPELKNDEGTFYLVPVDFIFEGV